VLMSAALFIGTRGFISRSGRCVLVFFAATSPATLIYAHEARSYMLMMALATLACLLAIRVARDQQRPTAGQLAGLAAVWVLLAATHHFGFLFGGALIAALVLHRPTGPGTSRLIGLGTLVSLVVVPLYALQLAAVHANPETTEMVSWITREPSFIAANSLGGLQLGFGGPVELAVLAAMLAIAAAAGIWQSAASAATPAERRARLAVIRVLLLSATLTLAGSLIVTTLAVPIITYRNLLVVAPALWLAFALAIDGTWRCSGRAATAGLGAAMLLLIGVRVARLELALQPDKEEWRASAEFVRQLAGCNDIVVNVGYANQAEPYSEALALAGGSARLHPIVETALISADPAVRRAALRRSVPADARCIVVWCVGSLPDEVVDRIAADIRAEWGEGAAPRVVRFEHQSCRFSWTDPECVIYPRYSATGAFVVVAR